jgi:hypothetical protein
LGTSSAEGIDQLEALGIFEARKTLPELNRRFLEETAVPFVAPKQIDTRCQ